MTLHLGILQTDNVLPEFLDEHGDYPDMFQGLFQRVQDGLRFTNYDVQRGPPAEIECDAYVITGSKRSVYEDLPWIGDLVGFVNEALRAQRKIVGVCFGHQLMAHYFGGRVEQASVGWAVGVHTSQVTRSPRWMTGNVQQMALLSSHKDQVVALPDNAELYLTNEVCPVAGFTVGDQVITVQGHPEFNKAYSHELMNMRRETLGEEIYHNGVASLTRDTSETVMASWLLDFVRGGAR
jgi:GMP synthase-like glutamine amidotransferase